ncbi:MAG: hypothetical protein ABIH78_04620 [Candidatus Peregrinibacteria bacterium]
MSGLIRTRSCPFLPSYDEREQGVQAAGGAAENNTKPWQESNKNKKVLSKQKQNCW